jgi:hypothetical protein
MKQIENVVVGEYHRVRWELTAAEDPVAKEVVLEEWSPAETKLDFLDSSGFLLRVVYFPFGSVVIFQEREL